MSNRAIGLVLMLCLGVVLCVVMMARAQVPLQPGPQKFPRPADMRGVVRQIVTPDGTIKIFAPKGSVKFDPDGGMSGESVITIKYVDPNFPGAAAK